jgi:hypothetical protein
MAYEPNQIILDIETSPNLAHVWGFYEQNVIEMERHWVILSYSVQHYPSEKITTVCLPDFPGYKKDKLNDELLVKSLWKLIDECDTVIGHNIKAFDLKKINSRFLAHHLPPPRAYDIVDTLLILRSNFGFSSNKLDDIMRQLGYGGKVAHHGKHTWLGAMNGDKKSWDEFRRYNPRDVQLTRWLYERIRGFAKKSQHPNLNKYTDGAKCPFCQGHLRKRGLDRTATGGIFQEYSCTDCGKYSRGPTMKGTPVTIRPR